VVGVSGYKTKITLNSYVRVMSIEGGKWYERKCNIGRIGGIRLLKKITQNPNLKMISIDRGCT
jgi:hypothetical protein